MSKNYKNEAESLVAFIDDRVSERLSELIKKMNLVVKNPAIVTAVNGNMITVKLPNEKNTFTVPNKSTATLVAGDNVYLENCAYVSEKFG